MKEVLYQEFHGEGLEASLRALQDQYRQQAGCVQVLLLRSPDQPGVWILETHWSDAARTLAPSFDSQKYRHWVFEVLGF